MLFRPKSEQLCEENIFNRVSDLELYQSYFRADFQVGKAYNAPYRVDKHPSLKTKYNGDRIIFADYAKGIFGNAIKLTSLIKDLKYYDTLQFINTDLHLDLANDFYIPNIHSGNSRFGSFGNSKDGNIDFRITYLKHSTTNCDYWIKKYDISLELLDYYNIYPASRIDMLINNMTYKLGTWSWENPMYVYRFLHEGKMYYKIYRPLANKEITWKFRGNAIGEVIQGFEQLEKSKLCIITKSLKDVVVLRSMGFNSCAPQGESMNLTQDFFDRVRLKSQCEKMVLLFDNDQCGWDRSVKISTEFNVPFFVLDERYGKDISDVVERWGAGIAKQLILKNLNLLK